MEAAATTLAQTLSGLLLDTKVKVPAKHPSVHTDSLPLSPRVPSSPRTLLDSKSPADIPPNTPAVSLLLGTFLLINVLQFIAILALWRSTRRSDQRFPYQGIPKEDYDPTNPLASDDDVDQVVFADDDLPLSPGEDSRGHRHLAASSPHHSFRHLRSLSASSRRPLLWSEPVASIHSGESEGDEGSVRGANPGVEVEEMRRGKWFFAGSVGFLAVVWATFGAVSLVRLG